MTSSAHKIRARLKDGAVEVKLLIQHPMETGSRKDPVSGRKIGRHFIRELRCEVNGTEVLSSDWGWGVARNPFLSFRVTGSAPGDTVVVSWMDNQGKSESVETLVK